MKEQNKKVQPEITQTQEQSATECKQEFYCDLQYNRAKRRNFFVFYALFLLAFGLFAGMMISFKQWPFTIIVLVIFVFVTALIPGMLKNYPVKKDEPELKVDGKDIVISGKEYKAIDIESVTVTVLLSPVSKLDSENRKYIEEMASKMPEDECFGMVDVALKATPKVKKGTVLYLTVNDCIGALIALTSGGVRHYNIQFSLKKMCVPAAFTITKEDKKKQQLNDVSKKERRKQLV